MGVPNLFNPDDFGQFWWFNWQDHWALQEAVNKQKTLNNPIYNIWPWNEKDQENLFLLHQQFHNDMNAATGNAGNDFTHPPLKDLAAMKTWYFNHMTEHSAAHQDLGV